MPMIQTTEEILDLVNEKDEVIGTMPRSEVYSQGLHNIRVVNCFIKNGDGKLWIPRRTSHKKIFPSALDFSAGGHVESKETYEEAFIKEAGEELNIDVTKTKYTILGTMNPHADNVGAFMTVYELESDEVPNFNSNDFTEYYWLTPLDLLQKLESGDPAKTDILPVLKKFYL